MQLILIILLLDSINIVINTNNSTHGQVDDGSQKSQPAAKAKAPILPPHLKRQMKIVGAAKAGLPKAAPKIEPWILV